jgi:hypothetical protein
MGKGNLTPLAGSAGRELLIREVWFLFYLLGFTFLGTWKMPPVWCLMASLFCFASMATPYRFSSNYCVQTSPCLVCLLVSVFCFLYSLHAICLFLCPSGQDRFSVRDQDAEGWLAATTPLHRPVCCCTIELSIAQANQVFPHWQVCRCGMMALLAF